MANMLRRRIDRLEQKAQRNVNLVETQTEKLTKHTINELNNHKPTILSTMDNPDKTDKEHAMQRHTQFNHKNHKTTLQKRSGVQV